MKALLCVLLLPGAALAMSGQDYLDHCRITSVYDRALCMGYLDALLRRDLETGVQVEVRGTHHLPLAPTISVAAYCLPTGIQLPLLRDVVVRRLGQLPSRRLRGDALPLIRGILARTYPPQAVCGH